MGGALGINIGKSIVGGADVKNKTLKLLIAGAVAGIIFAFVCLFMTLNPKFDFQESYDGKLRLFKLADTSGRTNLLIVRESTGDHMSYAIPFTLRDIACYGWLEGETYDFYLGSADAGAYIFSYDSQQRQWLPYYLFQDENTDKYYMVDLVPCQSMMGFGDSHIEIQQDQIPPILLPKIR